MSSTAPSRNDAPAPGNKGGQGGFFEVLALHYRIPLVSLVDGAGGNMGA